ncbi:MAG: EAL domain-containing protein [Anaerolineae bacterium]|nr:EAL domain-containing protein [Anaerolineae bacterium]
MRQGSSLRVKLLSAITAVLLVLVLVQYYGARTALISGFERLESERAAVSLQILRNVLAQNLAQIESSAQDYAFWDDAIAYVEEPSDEFIESNLNLQAFNNLKINVVIITNAKGEVVFAQQADWENKTTGKLSPELIALASGDGPLWRHNNNKSLFTGLVPLANSPPVLVASLPILDSNGEGEVKGALLMGRELNPQLIESLSKTSKVTFSLLPITAPPSAEYTQLQTELQQRASVITQVDERNLSAVAALNDIYGNPSVLYRIEVPRDLFNQAMSSTSFLLASSLAVFFVLGLISFWFDRTIIRRILQLTQYVSQVTNTDKSTLSRLPEPRRNDELGQLTHSMNAVLARIEGNMLERQQAEDRIFLLAHYDRLTRLPNRVLLEKAIQKAIDEATISQAQFALFFLDLDRFKNINDSLGHDAGDELLGQVADRLRAFASGRATISRLGGDEFVLLLLDVLNVDQVEAFASRLAHLLSQPCLIKGQEVQTSSSIGISLYPEDGHDVNTLLRNADAAMYCAKENGRNAYKLYDRRMNADAVERLTIENNLRNAIKRNELGVHYQPIADLTTGRIIGAEALARWHHPDLGMIPPLKFIPVAEETGLINEMGEWILRAVCKQVRAWLDRHIAAVPISVNISAKQLQNPLFHTRVLQIIDEFDLPHNLITIEITESTMMAEGDHSAQTLPALRETGLKIAMDDFGTGFSSFSRLHQLTIDTLKIDRSFIWQLNATPSSASIVKAIINMSRALRIRVVAEGVETEQQAEFLRQNHCDAMQGFYFSKALSAVELGSLLRNQSVYSALLPPLNHTNDPANAPFIEANAVAEKKAIAARDHLGLHSDEASKPDETSLNLQLQLPQG